MVVLAWGLLSIAVRCQAENLTADDFVRLFPTSTVSAQAFQVDSKAECYALIFLGVECPVARQYGAKLQPLAEQFAGKPVQFIGINSNPQDSQTEVAQYQRELKINFPMLKDSSQLLARKFDAKRTAEAVLIDKNGKVLYQGRIDDQFSPGVARGKTTSHDLRDAIAATLDGKPITTSKTVPVGCLITFKKEAIQQPTTTYTRDIAPLLWQHCYECHRQGEIGPFDVSDYEDLQGWAEMMVEVVQQKRMPPWHASPDHGSFKNERRMPEGVVEVLQRWIQEGMPFGDPAELPEKPKYIDGWRLPKQPDLVIEMRDKPYRVPAKGVVDYQYFVVDPGITEDRWVSGSQIIPGAASVVHHAIVFIRPPELSQFVGIGWLNAYVPGQKPVIYPEGYARKIPAGSKLVFQMHYTPSGTETHDVTKIGLNFVDADKVTHQMLTTIAIDQDFEIPPNTSAHAVTARMMRPPQDAQLMAISPHMHLRGKAFEVLAKKNDVVETILHVPNYDFNWQHTYELSRPMPICDITDISIVATFDNSKENPFNPNSDEYVMWGDQTFEEMALGYFDMAVPLKQDSEKSPRPGMSILVSSSDRLKSRSSDEFVQRYIDDTLKRFDRNHDGVIAKSEVSLVFHDYGFGEVDLDGDERITREELEKSARGQRD